MAWTVLQAASALENSASLPDMPRRAFRAGRIWATEETGLLRLPKTSPWSAADLLWTEFRPD